MESKICSTCGEEKPLSEYYVRKYRNNEPYARCIRCVKQKALEKKGRRLPKAGHKFCTLCDRELPMSGFPEESRGTLSYYAKCSDCKPRSTRERELKYKFKMTLDDYDELMKRQNHRCAICNRHRSEFDREFCVDHSHDCCDSIITCGNCVRGLLCHDCNRGEALITSPLAALRLIEYWGHDLDVVLSQYRSAA